MSSFERCVVLVADDEPIILELVSRALIQHGYDVIRASDGTSALRACRERVGPVHLAVLDIMMPGMSGPELFVYLQEIHPKIEALFMSGYRPDQILELLPALNTTNFIPKPFRPRALVERVNQILNNEDVCALL